MRSRSWRFVASRKSGQSLDCFGCGRRVPGLCVPVRRVLLLQFVEFVGELDPPSGVCGPVVDDASGYEAQAQFPAAAVFLLGSPAQVCGVCGRFGAGRRACRRPERSCRRRSVRRAGTGGALAYGRPALRRVVPGGSDVGVVGVVRRGLFSAWVKPVGG